MKNDKKKVPKLRFPGFEGDWEQRKVTELGEIYIGLVTTMTSHYTDHGALLIRNSDIKDGRFEFGDNPIYLDDEFAEKNASRKHKIGDVITVHTGDIGTSAVITEKEAGSIGFATIVTRPDTEKITSEYLCAYLNTEAHKNFAINISTGDGRNNYNLKDYYECIVPVPSVSEQKIISGFIDNLNKFINLHQRKLDQMKEYKAGMLQKMFPRKGEKVPEVRFSGFTDDWEQRKLGEVLNDLYNGQTPSRLREDYWNGTINWLSSGELNLGIIYECVEKITAAGQKSAHLRVVPAGTFVMAITGLEAAGTRGNCAILGLDTTLNQSCMALFPNKEMLIPEYLFQWYRLIGEDYGIRFTQGTKQQSYNAEIIKSLEISLPSVQEQKKIADLLSKLDETITLHQRKLDQMKEYKKGLLQQMFV